jgi:hypothetical protein
MPETVGYGGYVEEPGPAAPPAARDRPSRQAQRWIRRAAFVLVVLAVILFAGNAVARPGCSLLPVELPADPNRTLPGGTRAQACAALGRPMPEARNLPLGLHETALTVEGPPPVGADTHRRVSVFYAIETSNLVELTSQRGDQLPPGNVGGVNGLVNDSPAIITERTFPASGAAAAFSMVFYEWARGGLLHSLDVRLDRGITRATADQIAASVR